MTDQEVFDTVALHLLTQNERAENDDEGCQYRTPEGLTCAVGCLIPESMYDPAIEGNLSHQLPKDIQTLLGISDAVPMPSSGYDMESEIHDRLWLLCQLQLIHDIAPIRNWPDHLQNLAVKSSLDSLVVLNFEPPLENDPPT